MCTVKINEQKNKTYNKETGEFHKQSRFMNHAWFSVQIIQCFSFWNANNIWACNVINNKKSEAR